MLRRVIVCEATLELEKCADLKPKSFKNDDKLYLSGQTVSTQEIDGRFSLGNTALDLSILCVPIMDSLSLVAYSIVSATH